LAFLKAQLELVRQKKYKIHLKIKN